MKLSHLGAFLLAFVVVDDRASSAPHGGGYPPPPPNHEPYPFPKGEHYPPPNYPPPGNNTPPPSNPPPVGSAGNRPTDTVPGPASSPPPAGATGGAVAGIPAGRVGEPIAAGPHTTPQTRSSGGADQGLDWSDWQLWWNYNKHPYLDVRSRLYEEVISGQGELYLGRGDQGIDGGSMRPSERMVRERVVPALIEVLQTSRSQDVHSAALMALGKIGDVPGSSDLVSRVRRYLTDPNQEVAETAALALGLLADPTQIDLLIRLVQDDVRALADDALRFGSSVSERSRAFAAYGLGETGRVAGGYHRLRIAAALASAYEQNRGNASKDLLVACIVSMGRIALPLDSADTGENTEVGASVSSLQDQVRWLLGVLEDERMDSIVRAHAPVSIGQLLEHAPDDFALRDVAIEHMLSKLARRFGSRAELRRGCVLALGRLVDADDEHLDTRARRALVALSDEHGDQQLRFFSLISLARAASRAGSGDNPFAGTDYARRALAKKLARGKQATRAWAGLAMGVLERALLDAGSEVSPDQLAALRSALADTRSPAEAGALAVAVGIAKDVSAGSVLMKKLESGADPQSRGYFALALGMIDERGSKQVLRAVVQKAKYRPELLRSAALGLGLLGDKDVVDDLVELLADSSSLSSQSAVASAIGLVGDKRSIDPLVDMLRDDGKTELAKAFAAVALGIVSDDETYPWNTTLSVGSNYRAAPPTLSDPVVGTGVLDIL